MHFDENLYNLAGFAWQHTGQTRVWLYWLACDMNYIEGGGDEESGKPGWRSRIWSADQSARID
jgi:hypothetical protein